MKNAKFKKAFDKSYKEFLLSELLIAMMENDDEKIEVEDSRIKNKRHLNFIYV